MSHVWPDILVRGVGGTIVVRTRQLVKDARAANVLVYNGEQLSCELLVNMCVQGATAPTKHCKLVLPVYDGKHCWVSAARYPGRKDSQPSSQDKPLSSMRCHAHFLCITTLV